MGITINKHVVAILLIFLLGSILRFYNLNWDLGQYLHPDERLYINAANLALPQSLKEFLSPSSPLNPHMFYYGSFPLYLYKVIATVFIPSLDILMVSRLLSALFSSLTILVLYLATKQFFSEKIALISSLIFAFTPGSIQYAHFNTTESLLIFLMVALLYSSTRLYKEKKLHFAVYIGAFLGIAYATKIVGLTFGIFPAIAYALLFFEQKQQRKNIIISFFIFLSTAFLVGVSMAPYQLIDWTSFSKEQSFMQAVTYGKYKPPFVIIYENTTAYVYPLLNVLPFTYGFVALVCSALGLLLLKKQVKGTSLLVLLTIFPLLYFLWAGAWFAKFSRYYLILVPFLCIYAAIFLSRLRLYISSILFFLIILQGLLFFSIYLKPNTRIAASEWIYQTVPNNSIIATEHWDDPLPLQLSMALEKSFVNEQLTVYDEDTKSKIEKLSVSIAKSDYIILSSRRVSISILNNTKSYPYTSTFYNKLFAGKLGFSRIKEFTNFPYGFSDNSADESFQSYDHPPVVIFKNNAKKSAEQIQKELIQ